VHGGHAAGRRDSQPLAHGFDELVVLGEQVAVPELPGGFLAQDARRLAALVQLDDSALDLEIAVRSG
jgi:hypothetical protein